MKRVNYLVLIVSAMLVSSCTKDNKTKKNDTIEYSRVEYTEPQHKPILKDFYDAEGTPLKTVYYDTSYADTLVVENIVEYALDASGVINQEKDLNNTGEVNSQTPYTNTYNDKGKLMNSLWPHYEMSRGVSYAYNNNGTQIIKKTDSSDTTLVYSLKYSYTSEGLLDYYLYFNNEGIAVDSFYCTYNAKGQIASIVCRNNGGKWYYGQEDFSYNANSSLSEMQYFHFTSDSSLYSKIYDSNGRLMEIKFGKTVGYSYEYNRDDFVPHDVIYPESYDQQTMNIYY